MLAPYDPFRLLDIGSTTFVPVVWTPPSARPCGVAGAWGWVPAAASTALVIVVALVGATCVLHGLGPRHRAV